MRHLLFVLLLLLAACEPYDGDFRAQPDGVSGQAGLDGKAKQRAEPKAAPEPVVAEPETPEPVVPEPVEPTKPAMKEPAPSEPLGAAAKDDSLAALIAEEEAINSATSLGTAGETPEPTPAPRALAGAPEETPEPETEALGKVDAAPIEGAEPMPGSEKAAAAPNTAAAKTGVGPTAAATAEPAPEGEEPAAEAVAAVEPPPLTPGPDAMDPCEPDGLTTVAIGDLTLHQTFGEGESARALLRGDGGAEYVVGKGSVVGPEGARVVRVSPGEVVLAEIQFDMSGSPVLVQKALRMELPR